MIRNGSEDSDGRRVEARRHYWATSVGEAEGRLAVSKAFHDRLVHGEAASGARGTLLRSPSTACPAQGFPRSCTIPRSWREMPDHPHRLN
jgi:hypothetical protein